MEKNLGILKTKDLAFLEYLGEFGEVQYAVFDCEKRGEEGVFYRDIVSEEVYTLANDNGEKQQKAPLLVNHYFKSSFNNSEMGKAIRLSLDDVLFKAESAGFKSGEMSINGLFSLHFGALVKDLPNFKNRVKYNLISSKLKKEEILEDELSELVQAVNENETKLTQNPTFRVHRSLMLLRGTIPPTTLQSGQSFHLQAKKNNE